MEEYHVVSLSGGKDSTAMLLMMLERGMRVDEAIFCDTGMEFPGMIDHIDKIEREVDVKLTRLRGDYTFDYLMFDKPVKGREKQNKLPLCGYSWPEPLSRWCTSGLKTSVIDRHLNRLRTEYKLVQYIGIAADEPDRIKDKRYPLAEWGITEADALKYCYAHGYDWGGLYELFHRVSCWCCPLQPLAECKQLWKHFPELWTRLREMDDRTFKAFKAGWSVRQLENRFMLEEQLVDIKPKSRVFYDQINAVKQFEFLL